MDAECCYPAHAVMTVHISCEINFQSWLGREKKLYFHAGVCSAVKKLWATVWLDDIS